MSEKINVLVTGVSGGSFGEQICKSLKYGKNQYRIFAANIDLNSAMVVSADEYIKLPFANDRDYINELNFIISKNNIKYLIPGSEPELITISQNRDIIDSNNVKILINTQKIIEICTDKFKCNNFLSENGFITPKSYKITDESEIDKIEKNYPLIIKPSSGGGGSIFTFIAQNDDELFFFIKYLLTYNKLPIVQEYIGNYNNEYTVGVLNLPNGDFIGSIIMQRDILSGISNKFKIKNITNRKDLGDILVISSGITQGKFVENDIINSQVKKISEKLNSKGPINIQGRLVENNFVVFEINPRFSGTSSMRAMAGFNEPEILINFYEKIPNNEINIKFGMVKRALIEKFIYFT